MAKQKPAPPSAPEPEFQPFVPASAEMPEFTWSAVILGAVLGIIFGASSLYLVLKVGMTVSASIPVAVLAITLFRLFSRVTGMRRATILENNIVQTTGSAGESIAFGVGVTIPALMLLGFDMEVTRVMTVGVLGGLLGILMMIPLRRAFIVRQHGKLPYPEGTACADVLIVGEKGGATAATVFAGFGIAFVHKCMEQILHLWREGPITRLYTADGRGLRGGAIGGELSPELLGVGYIIGPRIASIMLAGGVLAYLVLAPIFFVYAGPVDQPLPLDARGIGGMVKQLRDDYILYIGAGAVATGGLISMMQALPLIFGGIASGLRDLRRTKEGGDNPVEKPRTERDLPMGVVLIGSLVLVLLIAAVPQMGLGFNPRGLVGAGMIVLFGFLFVTVSSRLTGEIGSSSNPISGMTVATLLLTCLVFLLMGETGKMATITALTVAAIVCIASSNGGTTAQDLKTGFLVGATPKYQQWAIMIGALTSALVMGVTLLLLNSAGTVYSTKDLPAYVHPEISSLTHLEKSGGQYSSDTATYHVWHALEGDAEGVRPGKYLLDDNGNIKYLVDPAINGRLAETDDGRRVTKFEAPKTRLMAIIIDGILNQKLPWELVLIGALIAVTLELAGVPSLPFAVGVYLPIQTSLPIFLGGMLRWIVDRFTKSAAAESESSPAVLLSSGFIAGGSLAGVLLAFIEFARSNRESSTAMRWISDAADRMSVSSAPGSVLFDGNWPPIIAFGALAGTLVAVGFFWSQRNAKTKV
ncbi:MAG: oligopeptide transporter, OPT family [Planctomycetia bacterium]|nr:oligopeptide transporter, OPT family [Planctomycetia bacterium]